MVVAAAGAMAVAISVIETETATVTFEITGTVLHFAEIWTATGLAVGMTAIATSNQEIIE